MRKRNSRKRLILSPEGDKGQCCRIYKRDLTRGVRLQVSEVEYVTEIEDASKLVGWYGELRCK